MARFLVARLAKDSDWVDRYALMRVLGGLVLMTFLPLYGGLGHDEEAGSGFASLYTLLMDHDYRDYWGISFIPERFTRWLLGADQSP